MKFSPLSCHFITLRSKYSPQHLVLKHSLSIVIQLPYHKTYKSLFKELWNKISNFLNSENCDNGLDMGLLPMFVRVIQTLLDNSEHDWDYCGQLWGPSWNSITDLAKRWRYATIFSKTTGFLFASAWWDKGGEWGSAPTPTKRPPSQR
jgi:hypothetical protein